MRRGNGGGRARRHVWGLLGAISLVFAGCSTVIEPPEPGDFYTVAPANVAGKPGDILKAEPFAGAPAGASAFRVLYRSTGPDGEPIAVSGVVVVPDGAVPPGGRPVVAWAHPTTGVARRCAPSLMSGFFDTVKGLPEMLARGYVVAATDYPGLGTGGTHPYLVGASAGRAVLDSVRAARRLAQADAGSTYAVWGHSQGGQAALFSGQIAASYAPELTLAGIAAAAPATDLTTLLRDDLDTNIGKVLAAYAMWSWHRVYDAPLEPVLDPAAKGTVDAIAGKCVENAFQAFDIALTERKLDKGYLRGDVTRIEPWKTLLARNSTGQAPAGAPVFLAQGTADKIVAPQVTLRAAEAICARRTPVEFDWLDGVSHNPSGARSATAAVDWMAGRFAGERAPDQCGNLPSEPGTAS